jgi:plasmid stabilization system protein ParE
VKIRYSKRALSQLAVILDRIRAESPAGAEAVQRRLKAVVDLAERHPFIGRAMKKPGLRRLVVDPYPYLVLYRATDAEVVILSIRHAARRPLARIN